MKRKKILLLLVTASTLFVLIACGNNKEQTSNQANKEEENVINSEYNDTIKADDFIESVTFEGIDWREYKTDDVCKQLNITESKGDIKEIWDKVGNYSIYKYCREEFGRKDVYISAPSELNLYNSCISFINDGEKNYISSIKAEKKFKEDVSDKNNDYEDKGYVDSVMENDSASDEEYINYSEGVVKYLENNNISSLYDILQHWNIKNENILEIIEDKETIGSLSYEYACKTEHGDAVIKVSNEASDLENRTVQVVINITYKDGSNYTISICESSYILYDVKYEDFTVTLSRPN